MLGGLVAVGPRPHVEESWVEPDLPADLDDWLERREAAVPDLRTGDGKGIVWSDPEERAPTPLAIVYLHGFSADRHEIEPVVSELGRRLAANVVFTRLAGHGRDGRAMGEATVEAWMRDATEAFAIGGRIGDRVVVVGTSTGGTLGAWLATRSEARERLGALVLVSPNFQPADRASRVLLAPWGGWIARLLVGPERCFTAENAAQERHWTTCYPTSALTPMMALVEHVRTSDFSKVDRPALVLYSPEDRVVDANETLRVVAGFGRRASVRVVHSGDPAHHVLVGDIVSPETNEEVTKVVEEFVREVVGGGR